MMTDNTWTVWFDETGDAPVGPATGTQDDFLERMVNAGECNDYESFRSIWRGLCDGHAEPPAKTNVRVFRSGVKPLWEDPANVEGGKFVVCIGAKDGGPEKFLATVAALMASDLSESTSLTGAVLSSRKWGHTISLWHSSAQPNDHSASTIESELRALVDEVNVSFHSHRKSINLNKADKDELATRVQPRVAAPKPEPMQPRVAARMSLRQRRSGTLPSKGSVSSEMARLEAKWAAENDKSATEPAQFTLLDALNPAHWSTTEVAAALVASFAAFGLVIVS